MRIAEAFGAARWRACWATTYTFEPAFFESFLLRRMGDPPFNAVVLGDARRLAETWAGIGTHDVWRVPGVNQRYLVRGLTLPGGAFHPKTILLGNEKRGQLLVGSGNLGITGLERGYEVYTRLESDADLAAFGAWREWMGELVGLVDDPLLRSRWADLLGRLPWLPRVATSGGAFLTNRRVPIAEQFIAAVPDAVDELHVTAPFFDHQLSALSRLVADIRPRKLVIYLGDHASVRGPDLADFIASSDSAVRVMGYVAAPDQRPVYVHAKLIAAVIGRRAIVLAGSANLSGPALLRSADAGSGANIEAGVLREVDADWARRLFFAVDRLAAVDLSIEQVQGFDLAPIAPGRSFAVRLASATRGSEGLVSVVAHPPAPARSVLTDGRVAAALADDRPVAALPKPEGAQLVWLATPEGDVLSNRVPVDDAVALERTLTAQEATGQDRPRELDPLDLRHPLGQILYDLHQKAVFDVDDTPAARRLASARASEVEDEEAAAFWERFFTEDLGRDPRAAGYRGAHHPGVGDALFLDEFGALLLQMLERAPRPNELRLLDGSLVSRGDSEGMGARWTDARRIRVRAYNVLARWANAVADPRVRWFGDLAPVRHYAALLSALARIWPQTHADADDDRWLTFDQLTRLFATLHEAFVQTSPPTSYLATAGTEGRARAIQWLEAYGAPSVAAALAFDALRNAKPATFFAWQPFLVRALEWGVIVADQRTVGLIEGALGRIVTVEDVERVLRRAAAYIDDEHWCARAATEGGFSKVELRESGNKFFPVDLVVSGAGPLASDPRLPGLVSRTLDYRRGAPFRLRVGSEVVAIALGTTVATNIPGKQPDSSEVLTREFLDDLEVHGRGLGGLFDDDLVSGVA